MSGVKICATCVLPSTFPNITFNDSGICGQCEAGDTAHQKKFDQRQHDEFQRIVKETKGKRPYDAIACFSGGKDSTYMLKMMVRDFELNVLAFTLDNGFITEQSKANIVKVVDILQVDHLFFKPSRKFMTRMYLQAIFGDLNKPRGNYQTRISDVCLSCISVVNTYAARLAMQNQVPMIFAGFTPGQIPRAVIKNNHQHYRQTYDRHRAHFEQQLGEGAERYLNLPDDGAEIYQMSPFLVYEKTEEFILEEIRELGWMYPEQLDGCTSNCALNAVGNVCHEKKYGFHPYALELSKLIRKGLLSRAEALRKLSLSVDDDVTEKTLVQLNITVGDINQLNTKAA
jgi:hypothetical protein